MRSRLLHQVERLVLDRPRPVLAAAVVLTGLAIWQGAGIELRTSRKELVGEGDAAQARYDALAAETGETQPLIVVLEREPGSDADPGEAAADLARRLEGAPGVAQVLYRLDPDWILRAAPWLADPGALVDALERIAPLIEDEDGALRVGDLADLDLDLARRIEDALATGSVLPDEGDTASAQRLAELIEAQAEFLAAPEEAALRLRHAPARAAAAQAGIRIAPDGTFAGEDGTSAFLFVLADDPDATLAQDRELVRLTRDALDGVLATRPGLSAGLTGQPAMTVEEMDTIARDGRVTSAVALVGVMLLASTAFHWRRHALLGLAVLVMGVTWAVAAVELQLGYLNMITTALIPILIGIGIDYAVHPLSQYELERLATSDRIAAVRATLRKTSAAVVVSALTTAGAFACFVLMEFRGFAELGQVAGVGVVLCLLAALLVLPALLVTAGRAPEAGPEPRALIERVWTPSVIEAICRWPGVTVAVAALVTVAAIAGARDVRLRSSLLELLPPTAESLRYLDRVESSSLGAYFNMVTADDLRELRALEARAGRAPEIRGFDSASRLFPDDTEAAAGAAARLADFLERLDLGPPPPQEEDRLPAALARLEQALSEAADTAFVSGLGEMAAAMERARAAAERARALVVGGRSPAQRRGEAQLRSAAAELRGTLLEAVAAGPPAVGDLPPRFRDRYRTSAGRWVAYLYPAGNVFDPEFLARFNAASRAVSPDTIGFPMLFEAHSADITDGFQAALGAGALLVVLLLAIDLRRPVDVVLALVPVLIGLVWMLGAMHVLGLSLNFANLVAIPLVLGVGIDAGVHFMHRHRLEGAAGMRMVMEHTGRALLIASLTTMVGFGSLMLAQHRGMAGLGALLLLGVGACLVAALVVLPNLLLLLGMEDR